MAARPRLLAFSDIYTNGGNQAFMIKSNMGSGYVRNVLFQNFIARGTAYGLNVNQYWSSQSPGSGAGVQLSNITFQVRPPYFLNVPRFSHTQPNAALLTRTGTGMWQTGYSAPQSSSSALTARRAST